MDPLRQEFNTLSAQEADWSIRIAPLLMLLILDDIARRETRRRRRIDRINSRFNALATKQSRDQYRQHVADTYSPQPRRISSLCP